MRLVRSLSLFTLLVLVSAGSSLLAQILLQGIGRTSASGGVPTGGILFVDTGTCPAGFAEVAGLNGRTLLGTIAANMDVGGTGGSDSITPTTNSISLTAAAQTISGNTADESSHTHSVTSNVTGTVTPAGTISWPAGVPTFAGTPFSSVINHTHTVMITDPGHTHVQTVNSATTGPNSGYGVDTSTNNGVNSGYSTASATTGITASTANPAGGVSSITPAGTVAWPAGVPTFAGTSNQALSMTNNAVTSGVGSAHHHGAGTLANASSAVSGTVTINSFDNRSAYVKWIACKAS